MSEHGVKLCEPRPTCRALKSKQLYVTGGEPDPEAAPIAGYHWCIHTMTTIGPDDDLVIPQSCRPGRACFEP